MLKWFLDDPQPPAEEATVADSGEASPESQPTDPSTIGIRDEAKPAAAPATDPAPPRSTPPPSASRAPTPASAAVPPTAHEHADGAPHERTYVRDGETSYARILCVANQKGGVGKTTTAVSLAAALAEAGAEVLLVDLDPQGNATTGLGLRVNEGDASSYGILVQEADADSAIEPTSVRGLACLPSSLDLAGAEIELVPAFSREHRLRKSLDDVRDRFDVVLIDCPPALGLLTINALVASDQVLLPIQCEYYALEGVGQLTRTLDLVRRGLNANLEIGGVVLTMYDARTRLSQQVADEVREHFGDLVFRTIIPRTVRLSEAPGFGQPITVFDPSSRGARAYLRLADEVAERLDLPLAAVSTLDTITGDITGPRPDDGPDDGPDDDHDEEPAR